MMKFVSTTIFMLAVLFSITPLVSAKDIIHDAEYAIIKAQNGKAWAADNKIIDKKLSDIRKKNDGKPPNIVYILLDDVGFGEIG
ncbi:MAG: sulfatase, partial [Gammaproteobacteria bacterium]|nr:sulfatase [Gammaproteobacteria bacterium]